MSFVDAEVADWRGTEAWLQRISVAAAVNLSASAKPDFVNVPERLRRNVADAHDRLREIVLSVLELRTCSEDLTSFRGGAVARPIESEFGAYHQLKLMHSHFVHLSAKFDVAMLRFADCYNDALKVLSADETPVDIIDLVRGPLQNAHSATLKPEQCYAVSLGPIEQPLPNRPWVASRWPTDWPEGGNYCEQSRNELVSEVASCIDCVHFALTRLVLAHGQAIEELISRHNIMLQNFESPTNLPDRG